MESAAGNNIIGPRKFRPSLGRGLRARNKNSKHVSQSAPTYDRKRDLPGLIALWPWEIEDDSLENLRRIVDLLQRALRLERKRGIERHWTYDVARHARLLAAYRSESANLNAKLRAAARQTAKQQHERTRTSATIEHDLAQKALAG